MEISFFKRKRQEEKIMMMIGFGEANRAHFSPVADSKTIRILPFFQKNKIKNNSLKLLLWSKFCQNAKTHDTTAPKESSSKLVKQRTSLAKNKKKKGKRIGQAFLTHSTATICTKHNFLPIKNINLNTNKQNYKVEQCEFFQPRH